MAVVSSPRFDADAFMAGIPASLRGRPPQRLVRPRRAIPLSQQPDPDSAPARVPADTANTIIPLLMAPKAASYSDFTAQGLPIAVDAYNASSSNNSGHDGFVWQTGVTTAVSSGYPLVSDQQ